MSKLRDNSKVFNGVLLFFFVLSMTVGGLVGGANILTTMQGWFGKVNTNLYVGKVGNEEISIDTYRRHLSFAFNNLNRNDARGQKEAYDRAWDAAIEEVILSERIDNLNLQTSNEEIYNFLVNEPPQEFKTELMKLGFYIKDDGQFDILSYQDDAKNKTLPSSTRSYIQQLFKNPRLSYFLSTNKLRNLLNNTASVSEYEIMENYQKSLKCNVNIIGINTKYIDNELINISDDDLLKSYNENKNDYFNESKIKLEYVFWDYINDPEIPDSTEQEQNQNLLQDAIDFSSTAELKSYNEALEEYNLTSKESIEVTESFESNSGIPFSLGFRRDVVRFAFNNPIGTTSSYIVTPNGIGVFSIIDEIDSYYSSFEDVKENIRESEIIDRKKDYAKNELEKIKDEDWEQLSNDNDLFEYATNNEAYVGGRFDPMSRKSTELESLLLGKNKGKSIEVLSTSDYLFLADIESIDSFIESDFNTKKDSIKNQLLNIKRGEVFRKWLEIEKENLDIIDLRHKVF